VVQFGATDFLDAGSGEGKDVCHLGVLLGKRLDDGLCFLSRHQLVVAKLEHGVECQFSFVLWEAC